MDNSYLFRGKRLDNDDWVIGGYTEVDKHSYIHHNRTIKHDKVFGHTAYCLAEVKRETVGRCTGRKAAKSYRGESDGDRLIWEGDIVESISHKEFFSRDGMPMEVLRRKCIVEYWHGQLLLVERYEQYGNDMETKWCMCTQDGNDLEIIGCVHEREPAC